jgi:hypothetical protein
MPRTVRGGWRLVVMGLSIGIRGPIEGGGERGH